MIMSKEHPQWEEFLARLEGPEGCNFGESVPGDPNSLNWKCAGGNDKTFATNILRSMGFSERDIKDSCEYFENHGGYCDCEILFNVDA
jgi:hypothetical protein